MACFTGKWKVDKSEGVTNFFLKLGFGDYGNLDDVNSGFVDDITADEKHIKVVEYMGKEKIDEHDFNFGEDKEVTHEADPQSPGAPKKSKIRTEINAEKNVITLEDKSDTYEAKYTRTLLSPNRMRVTMETIKGEKFSAFREYQKMS